MNLKPQLNEVLNRLRETPSTEPVSLPLPGGRIELQLQTVNELACSFTRVEVQSDKLATATVEDLKRISTALAAKLSYLMEPLRAMEVDGDQCVVQMRSSPPSKTDNGTCYFELIAQHSGLSLRRYSFHKPTAPARQPIPATVTLEVFQRLLNDLASAVTE